MSRFLFGMRPPVNRRPPRKDHFYPDQQIASIMNMEPREPALREMRNDVSTESPEPDDDINDLSDPTSRPTERCTCKNCRKSIIVAKPNLAISPVHVYIGPRDDEWSLEFFCTRECQWSFMFRTKWMAHKPLHPDRY
mmetsp:Transcript_45725/g.74589  ORF Transcript_45725/g.74589 Transcript_45725/m.74589 type:complete len:137 (-) Transcript_45725:544-954(-)